MPNHCFIIQPLEFSLLFSFLFFLTIWTGCNMQLLQQRLEFIQSTLCQDFLLLLFGKETTREAAPAKWEIAPSWQMRGDWAQPQTHFYQHCVFPTDDWWHEATGGVPFCMCLSVTITQSSTLSVTKHSYKNKVQTRGESVCANVCSRGENEARGN